MECNPRKYLMQLNRNPKKESKKIDGSRYAKRKKKGFELAKNSKNTMQKFFLKFKGMKQAIKKKAKRIEYNRRCRSFEL